MAPEQVVVVVEDDPSIADLVDTYLRRDGFRVYQAADGETALKVIKDRQPKLLILDLGLPGLIDGIEVCRQVRSCSDIPIIMLTARDDELDRVLGLELGADDYVVKPFSSRELTARIHAIMRRGRARDQKSPIEIGALRLDPSSRTLSKDDEPVELAAREFDLLHLLMANAGEVLRRERIMDDVWDPHWFGPTKTLDVHISWLRKKIEDDPSHPTYITTIRGVGFRFRSDGET